MKAIEPKEFDISKLGLEETKSCMVVVNNGKAHLVHLPKYGNVTVMVQNELVTNIKEEKTFKIK